MSEIIRRELRKFGENTSVKGVCRTIKADSRVVRIFWLSAVLVCFALMLFQVLTVVLNYSHRRILRNTLISQLHPDFPDVTFCNILPVLDVENFTQLYDEYLARVQLLENQAPEKFKAYTAIWNYFRMLLTFNFNLPILQIAETRPKVLEEFIVSAKAYGWDLFTPHELTASTFLGRPLQLCKTIRPKSNTAAIDVILFINHFFPRAMDLYYDWIRVSLSAGVKVMIHPKGTKPDPITAIFVSPGTELTIGVNQQNFSRLPHPYGSCSDRTRIYPDDDDSPPYSTSTCISLCRQRQYVTACGCLDAYEYFTDAELKMGDHTFCENVTQLLLTESQGKYVLNKTFAQRKLWSVMGCAWNFIPDETLCDCPISCMETIYAHSSSWAYWPDVYYQLGFYNVYIRNDKRYSGKFAAYEKIRNRTDHAEVLDELQNLKLIERNFIHVYIKIEDKCTQIVKDIPAVSWDTLASNLGGSLNLWLGISVMTLAEIVELIYSLVKTGLTRKRTDVCIANGTK